MDHANYNPTVTPLLLESGLLGDEWFTLVDVGCSGGLDPLWGIFGEKLRAVGVDPQRTECMRLRQENNPRVEYVPAFIGLPADHPFHLRKKAAKASHISTFDWPRTSAEYGRQLWDAHPVQSNTVNVDLSPAKISVTQLVQDRGWTDVDFIKTDTDGCDFEAVQSAEGILRPCNVLGLLIEAPLIGGADDTANTFHNIDRYMRQQGFALYGLTVNRYSRKDLPAPFVYSILAQTQSGQVIWGDAIYLRDALTPGFSDFWGAELSLPQLAKLACLYELFCLPDCAAELINAHRASFAAAVDPDRLLDALVPPLPSGRHSYAEYMRRFREDVKEFFPRPVEQLSARASTHRTMSPLRLLRGILRRVTS